MRTSTLSILLLCIMGASFALDANQQILQQALNGFYEQNKLADPTTIVPCVDTATAAKIVALVPQVLKKASSVITIAGAATLIQDFIKNLNPAVGQCLEGNAEGLELATVFDVSGITPSAAIAWATGHPSTVTGEAATLNKLWTSGQYNSFGNNASAFAHTVISQIGKSKHLLSESNDANQNIIQQVLNGFYEQNNLADPTTIVPCIDTTTAAQIVALVPQVLKKASSVLTISQILPLVQNFVKGLNPAVGQCLEGNAEGLELATVFDISGITQDAAISWATGHVSTVTGEASTLNKLWTNGSYNSFGNNASSFAHTVISQISGKSETEINATNQQILQDFYNGLYAQQGLPNPKFTVCYPDAAAADFVSFAPSFLKKASSILTINAAFNDLQTFTEGQGQKYPEIATCSQDYASELQALSDALGVKNPATVQQTIKDYVTSNLSSTTKAFGDANSSWKSGNYVKSGSQVSAWVKLSLAKNQFSNNEQAIF